MPYLDLVRIFTYHPPSPYQATRYQHLREGALAFARLIEINTPESAEQTLAIRALQQATMWANAAIAINEPDGAPA